MKNLYYLITAILGIIILFSSCENEIQSDTTPPGQITNVKFLPTNGGGYFTFVIPSDEDFLYVRGEYVIDNGKTISKTSSVYSDTLFVEGFGQEKEYEVKLYSVDRSNNHSKPVIMRIKPLAPTTAAVLETLHVQPGFSSIVLDWKNELKQPVTIFVEVEVGGTKVTKIYASNLVEDRFTIDNLKGVPHTVRVYIWDTYENQTQTRDYGQITPLIDGPISKTMVIFARSITLWQQMGL